MTVAGLNARWAKLRSLPYLLTSTALTIPYFCCAELRRKVRNALAERSYDRIFVYCSAMAQYVESVDRIPIVTDLVDVDSDKWTQYATFTKFPLSAVYRREGRTLARYERRVCEKSAVVVVTTEREARLVRQISPAARIRVIPNGVDTDFFSSAAVSPDAKAPAVGFTRRYELLSEPGSGHAFRTQRSSPDPRIRAGDADFSLSAAIQAAMSRPLTRFPASKYRALCLT